MIKVYAKFIVTEKNRAEFLEKAEDLINLTKDHDEGCIEYDIYHSTTNPEELVMFETWESPVALDRHSKSDHYKKILPELSQLTEGTAEVSVYSK